MGIKVSWFDHVRDVTPRMEAMTWSDFASTLERMSKDRRDVSEKLNSPLVSPALYADGATRNNANVMGFGGWFAIDVDDAPCQLQDAAELCRAHGVDHIIWTTTSHTPEKHRFRVVFPLDRWVERDEMAQLWGGAHAFFNEWGDVKTKDPARLMIAPAQWQGTAAQFIRVDGLGSMDVDKLLAMAPPPSQKAAKTALKQSAPTKSAQITSADYECAQLALKKWKQKSLSKADLQGVKAEYLIPRTSTAHRHGRGGRQSAAAKKTLQRMIRAAK